MSDKIELILNEFGKQTINNLLKDDKPININNFLDNYYSLISKSKEKADIFNYLQNYDYNFKLLFDTISSLNRYYPEIENITKPLLESIASDYPLNEKSYKKLSDKFSQNLKKNMITSNSSANLWEEAFENLFVSILKFAKNNFDIEDIEAKTYLFEKDFRNAKDKKKPKDLVNDLNNFLSETFKSSPKGKSKTSFLSSFLSKDKRDSNENLDESLKDIITIFIKNMNIFLEFDENLRERISNLEEKAKSISTLNDSENFKKLLKNIFLKLDMIKNSLDEEKNELKNIIILMADTFKNFVGESNIYSKELDDFIEKIKKTEQITEIKKLKIDVIQSTMKIKERTDFVKEELVKANEKIRETRDKLKKIEEELDKTKEKALYDGLTKAYNRAMFDDKISKELQKSKRDKTNFFLLMIDIDYFKKINDTYGHQTGDMVLKILTQQIQKVIREIDFFARYGGEEFSLILPEIDEELAKEISERVRSKIEKTKFVYNSDHIKVTISIGMTKSLAEDSVETIIGRADKALYNAKHSGRNRVVYI